jgi:hypothetical protein
MSCNNDDEFNSTNSNHKIIYYLDKIPNNPITNAKGPVTDIKTLMSNPNDLDDQKINNYLYEISIAIKDLIKDPNFNHIIIDLAKKSEISSANLMLLESISPYYFNYINAQLAKNNLSLSIINNNLTHMPVAPNSNYPSTLLIERYYPAIFVPNIKSLNENYQPIISPNIEVDSRNDPTLEDNIIAWYFQDSTSNNVTEIIISEQTVKVTANPIFLMDNSTLEKPSNNFNSTPMNLDRSLGTPGSTNGTRSFSSREVSIESPLYRFESPFSGKSEYAISGQRKDIYGRAHWEYDGDFQKTITTFSDNEFGTIKYVWSHHSGDYQPWANANTPNYDQIGKEYFFWNTFEYDWNRSGKNIGKVTHMDSTSYVYGNMKYRENWYSWEPSTVQIHYTRFEWIDYDWAHWNNSYKSKFRIWKVYI